MLTKGCNEFDCLINEMLFIRERKPSLNVLDSRKTLILSPKIKLNNTPFLTQDLRYILRVFVEGVLLFTLYWNVLLQ